MSELTASEPTTAKPAESEAVEPAETPFISAKVAIIAVFAVACIIGLINFWCAR